jgi:hypothetical protein|tara:strand:+ start:1128 stop:1874 length:747 start_codon:yes stop_codon:yes gene_type:complete
MENKLSAYLWGYTNYEAGSKSVETFRKFYKDEDIFIRVDTDGDIKNYTESTDTLSVDIQLQKKKVGYPGMFREHDVGRDHWPYENLHTWLTSIYDCCKLTDSKYMVILEEDVFLMKRINIIDTEFGIAIVRNRNKFPRELRQFIQSVEGNSESQGYGGCGGAIINTQDFIKGYDIAMNPLKEQFDEIAKKTKLVGWSDIMIQVVIMCGKGKVVVNPQLIEPWMESENWISDSWKNYEMVNYLKDISLL